VSFGDFDGSDYVIPANWLSLWTALVSIGVMGGSLLAGFLCERFGTRSATILGGIVGVGGALTCAFANLCALLNAKRVTFLMGKIIIGLGLGLMMPASQTYVSEVAPRKLRGALLSSFTLFMVQFSKSTPLWILPC
jgi:MFS family permease